MDLWIGKRVNKNVRKIYGLFECLAFIMSADKKMTDVLRGRRFRNIVIDIDMLFFTTPKIM